MKDLGIARKFYEEILGLTPVGNQDEELITFRSGGSRIFVYRSRYAGTNKATAMSWAVGGELDRIVEELRKKGVVFEHYDMPGMTLEGDVHVAGSFKVAWFRDPDGNILSLANG